MQIMQNKKTARRKVLRVIENVKFLYNFITKRYIQRINDSIQQLLNRYLLH